MNRIDPQGLLAYHARFIAYGEDLRAALLRKQCAPGCNFCTKDA
jgi:hypothetical protein